MVLKEDITDKYELHAGLLHRFAAVDLAPNEQLETGFSALDRDRNLIRMDKFYKDETIISAIENLGPLNGTAVLIDMPKSLSIPGRWRQEEIKMHPLRLKRKSGTVTSRFDPRGMRLYDLLERKGIVVMMYFNYWTRVNYGLLIPFRSRSPQGCRSLQSTIEQQLSIKNMPTNLAPSSVLESMVGAYASWSLWAGKPRDDFEIHVDQTGYRFLIPKQHPHLKISPRRRYRHRHFIRRMGANPE